MWFTTILPGHWKKPVLGMLLLTIAGIAVFWETWVSIVAIWIRSETFAHGFLVAPVSLWLVWTKRKMYSQLQPQCSIFAVLMVAFCGLLWLLGELINALVIQQFAVVGMLISAYWAVLGNQLASKLLFPLNFLFLMVPFGEDFVPILMEYTATFAVGMLRLTGISVYREGLNFTLTSGHWSVVDACSGIRYLIASITLGAVFAYLNYNSFKKRLCMMAASVLVPIIANGFRAYMIVMIGHLSDMKLATGVDHIIYGWVFFGLVMLLLFYVGSLWQDPPLVYTPTPAEQTAEAETPAYRYYWQTLATTLLCFSIWPAALIWLTAHRAVDAEIPEYLFRISGVQQQSAGQLFWQPKFHGATSESRLMFNTAAGGVVAGYVVNFGNERHGELVNSRNSLVPQLDTEWQVKRKAPGHGYTISKPNVQPVDVEETVLQSETQNLLVVSWYRVGSLNTSSEYRAKWQQLLKRLTANEAPELRIILYTEIPQDDYRKARENLQEIISSCCE